MPSVHPAELMKSVRLVRQIPAPIRTASDVGAGGGSGTAIRQKQSRSVDDPQARPCRCSSSQRAISSFSITTTEKAISSDAFERGPTRCTFEHTSIRLRSASALKSILGKGRRSNRRRDLEAGRSTADSIRVSTGAGTPSTCDLAGAAADQPSPVTACSTSCRKRREYSKENPGERDPFAVRARGTLERVSHLIIDAHSHGKQVA